MHLIIRDCTGINLDSISILKKENMDMLDSKAKAMIEQLYDEKINNPLKAEEECSLFLLRQGIQPNLEATLSHTLGYLQGVIEGFYLAKYGKHTNYIEKRELEKILKSRVGDLRQAFVRTRIQ